MLTVRHPDSQEHPGHVDPRGLRCSEELWYDGKDKNHRARINLCIGTDKLVIKAQVLAGGRGKGKFDNGFQGGVHVVNRYALDLMHLNSRIVTESASI